jgi:hypothetical protein
MTQTEVSRAPDAVGAAEITNAYHPHASKIARTLLARARSVSECPFVQRVRLADLHPCHLSRLILPSKLKTETQCDPALVAACPEASKTTT